MVKLRQIKKNTLLKIIITILIIFLIWFNFIVSKERNIEIDAGHYLIKNDIKDSVKLINAERVGYYGGLSSEQIVIASDSGLHNTEWVVFFGNITDQDKILGSDYSLKKMFTKNNQGIFIFKKVKDAK